MAQYPNNEKIRKLHEIQLQNKIEVDRKEIKYNEEYLPHSILKSSNVLYDSEWLLATDYGEIEQDENAEAYIHYSDIGTLQKGQEQPIFLEYYFHQEINIPERFLPYIESTLMIKTHPRVKSVGILRYQPKVYNPNPYWKITTDGNLVYQGYEPYTSYFSQEDIDNGNILEENTSKWVDGEITYTDGGDTYRLVGVLTSVGVIYDTSFVPGASSYDHKHFICSTFDSISGGTISGQGDYREGTWVEVSPGFWQLQYTDTQHESNKTVSLTDPNNTIQFNVLGQKYKNGILQSGSTHTFVTTGDYLGGSAVVTDFGFDYRLDNNNLNEYKLHYSSRRLKQLQVNFGSQTLLNFPDINDWNATDSEPFSTARIEVNPEGYPISQDSTSASYHKGTHYEAFGRIVPKDSTNQKFLYHAEGTLQLSTPASINNGVSIDFVNETYSFGGSIYSKDSDNRDDQILDFWYPSQEVVEFKLKLTLKNPLYVSTIDSMKVD